MNIEMNMPVGACASGRRRCEEESYQGCLRASSSRGTEQDEQLYLPCCRQQTLHPDQLFELNSVHVLYLVYSP